MTHTLHVWNDLNCGSGYKPLHNILMSSDKMEQAYYLSPNPNTGRFTLSQKIIDNQFVHIKVFNPLGVAVYDNMPTFVSGNADIDLENITSGVYILQLTNSFGNKYFINFIIEKK